MGRLFGCVDRVGHARSYSREAIRRGLDILAAKHGEPFTKLSGMEDEELTDDALTSAGVEFDGRRMTVMSAVRLVLKNTRWIQR